MKTVNWIVAGAMFIAASLGLVGASAASGADPEVTPEVTVVELFTSQGCNSCPPADQLLSELAQRDGVLVLSWNVEYWDYLGWKDTLARPGNSDRQRAYNQRLGRPGVYTPEMIVQGMYHVPGSDREAVEEVISRVRGVKRHPLRILVDEKADVLNVQIVADEEGEHDQPCDVMLVSYDHEHKIPIQSGENDGAELTYTNVVSGTKNLGTWKGGTADLQVDKADLSSDGNAILIQGGPGGPLVAAHIIRLSR